MGNGINILRVDNVLRAATRAAPTRFWKWR